jgi:nitrite reductase/ring-hydroxylating ferredoxin subunit
MAAAEPLIAVCDSDRLAEGGAGVRFEVAAQGQSVGAFVIRHGGRVYGYLNRCAHAAMELDWLEGQFFDAEGQTLICATHGAAYEPASGRCIGGPCAGHGGLRRLQIVEAQGKVYWRPEFGLRPRADRAAAD